MPTFTNRSAGTAARNGTTSSIFTYTPVAAGSLLVAVACGGSTFSWPAGWTERLQPINQTELSVATRASATAGESSVAITAGNANYLFQYVVFEFPPGSTWAAGVALDGQEQPPTLSGLTGTNWIAAAISRVVSSGATYSGAVWTAPFVEDVDAFASFSATDGAYLTVASVADSTATSITPNATVTRSGGSPTGEVATFAVAVAAASDTTAPTVPANLRTTAVGATSADLAWDASTDNVAVTGYEVVVTGPL